MCSSYFCRCVLRTVFGGKILFNNFSLLGWLGLPEQAAEVLLDGLGRLGLLCNSRATPLPQRHFCRIEHRHPAPRSHPHQRHAHAGLCWLGSRGCVACSWGSRCRLRVSVVEHEHLAGLRLKGVRVGVGDRERRECAPLLGLVPVQSQLCGGKMSGMTKWVQFSSRDAAHMNETRVEGHGDVGQYRALACLGCSLFAL